MPRLAYSLLLLLPTACWSAKDSALFESTQDATSSAGGSAAASSGASSGTDAGLVAQANGASAAASGGSAGAVTGGGSAGAAIGLGEGGASVAEPPLIEPPLVTDCAMVEGASVGDNGHCYRVNEAELTFSDASQACAAAGGHLVTIGDEAENELAEGLHDGEHWIGANDGLADGVSGVGTYTWVDASAWDYSDWEDGQPNAFETNCPDEGDESDCFEHCAFQTDEGDWNDRSCWHLVVSVCEWDVEAKPPAEGAGGVAGSGAAEP